MGVSIFLQDLIEILGFAIALLAVENRKVDALFVVHLLSWCLIFLINYYGVYWHGVELISLIERHQLILVQFTSGSIPLYYPLLLLLEYHNSRSLLPLPLVVIVYFLSILLLDLVLSGARCGLEGRGGIVIRALQVT